MPAFITRSEATAKAIDQPSGSLPHVPIIEKAIHTVPAAAPAQDHRGDGQDAPEEEGEDGRASRPHAFFGSCSMFRHSFGFRKNRQVRRAEAQATSMGRSGLNAFSFIASIIPLTSRRMAPSAASSPRQSMNAFDGMRGFRRPESAARHCRTWRRHSAAPGR